MNSDFYLKNVQILKGGYLRMQLLNSFLRLYRILFIAFYNASFTQSHHVSKTMVASPQEIINN